MCLILNIHGVSEKIQQSLFHCLSLQSDCYSSMMTSSFRKDASLAICCYGKYESGIR